MFEGCVCIYVKFIMKKKKCFLSSACIDGAFYFTQLKSEFE